MMTKKEKKPPKPSMTPEQRVCHLLAGLLVEATDFNAGWASLLPNLAPAVQRLWHQAKLEQQLLTPVREAMESGDPQRVLKAIYQRPGALDLLNVMGKNWQAQEAETPAPTPAPEAQS